MTDQEIIYKAISEVVNTDKPAEFAAHNSTCYTIAKYVCEELREKLNSLPAELVNFDEAEKEKDKFVSGNYIECRASFNGFKEENSYWFEYVGDDNYIGRSDNILNQKFHITPRQLYTLFTQQHCPKGECGVSLQKKPLISRIYNWFKCLINSNIDKQ